MKDPLFVEFATMKLNEQIETAKATITSGNLTLDEVIAAAQGIKALESRIDRMHNPRTRKPKVIPTELAEAA